jgi:hypothetical protein
MKTHRWFLVPALSIAMLALAASSFAAVTAAVESGGLIPISIKLAAKPESLLVSGMVRIKCSRVEDPDFHAPAHVAVAVDLSGVTARGVTSGATYVIAPAELVLWRPLAANDVLQLSVAFYRSGDAVSSAQTAQVSLSLTYDLTTGKLTTGSVSASTTTSP